jgi:hypothetical protein
VTFELIVLALATAVRPTSLAVVYALLGGSSPRQYMVAYVLAGAAFTITFGFLVIWIFHGIAIHPGSSQTRAVAEICGGVISITLGVLLLTGRIGKGSAREAPPAPSRWTRILNERISVRTAAVAGPATHIPGLFYFLALNLIVSQQVKLQSGVLSLLLYNAVWFCLPIAALTICIVNPESASDLVGTAEQWARRNFRTILTTVSFGIGVAFLVDGLRSL